MTQADNATALRRSLDPKPTHGQGQAQKITAKTPLPKGWASFCSKPDSKTAGHWYATAPYNLWKLFPQGAPTKGLVHTVSAPTWVELHTEVAKQVKLFNEAMERS